jgi:hypothetical protein
MAIMHKLYFLIIVLSLASCSSGKPDKIDVSVDLDKFSGALIKYGYEPCANFDYCFNGKFITNIKFEALPEGLVVTFPTFSKLKRLDSFKELSTIETILAFNSTNRLRFSTMCKKSINSWVYGLVADKCLAI